MAAERVSLTMSYNYTLFSPHLPTPPICTESGVVWGKGISLKTGTEKCIVSLFNLSFPSPQFHCNAASCFCCAAGTVKFLGATPPTCVFTKFLELQSVLLLRIPHASSRNLGKYRGRRICTQKEKGREIRTLTWYPSESKERRQQSAHHALQFPWLLIDYWWRRLGTE